MLIKQKADSVC